MIEKEKCGAQNTSDLKESMDWVQKIFNDCNKNKAIWTITGDPEWSMDALEKNND